MFFSRLFLGVCFVLGLNSCFGVVERQVSAQLTEERVNGRLFGYRIDSSLSGKGGATIKEQWIIDSKPVSRQEYELAFEKEFLEEFRKEREAEYQNKVKARVLKEEQRVLIVKKLLKNFIEKIEERCASFKKQGLEIYMAYSPDTIASEIDFINGGATLLEPAKRLLEISGENFKIEDAQKMVDMLEGYSKKVEILFESTVKKAVASCNDTEKLKKFLQIL